MKNIKANIFDAGRLIEQRFLSWLPWIANGLHLTIGIVGISLAIIALFIQCDNTSLTLHVTSTTDLVSSDISNSDKISILFDNQPMNELWLTSFRIVNDGDTPIRSDDFDEPITFRVEGGNILEVRSGSLQKLIREDDKSIEVLPQLFNPGDSLYFSLITDTSITDVRARVRIAGLAEIKIVKLLLTDELPEEITFYEGLAIASQLTPMLRESLAMLRNESFGGVSFLGWIFSSILVLLSLYVIVTLVDLAIKLKK